MLSFRFVVKPLLVVGLLLALSYGTARAGVPGIDTAGLQQLLEDSPDSVFLLDVRTPREFSAGRISGSTLVPMNQVPGRLDQLPRDRRLVVVCASGARSGAVTNFLLQNGFPLAVNYTGGVYDWSRRGLPLER